MFLVLSGGAAQIDSYEMHVSPTKSVSKVESKEKMIWFVRNEPFPHETRADRQSLKALTAMRSVHRETFPGPRTKRSQSVQNWGDMMKYYMGH